jgi:hypothetical protein
MVAGVLIFILGSLPTEVPHLAALRVSEAPLLDGRLDDSVWRDAPASDAFIEKYPVPGRPAPERTVVRVVYDARDLFVGIDCDQAGGVIARLTRRDREVDADRVSVDLATRGDGRSAFHFEVSAAGVLVDGVRSDDTELSLDWDENWEARTATTARGWSAEIRIPLRVLRFADLPSQLWGLQVRRYVSQRQEIDEWAFIPRSDAGEVSRYGTVGPLSRLAPGWGLELRPFTLGRITRSDTDGTELGGSLGVDAKWHLGQDITLDATANPDYSQVEADEVVLNLSTFETFYPEKRPFFLEGLDTFATPIPVLYTRRIGVTPIYGAGKLVGRAGGVTVGAMSAVTADGLVDEVEVPKTAYQALRLEGDLVRGLKVGGIGTAVLRFDEAMPARDAWVGGLDARWRSPGAAWHLEGQVLGSRLVGGPAEQLPDGTRLEAGDTGLAGHALVERAGGSLRGGLLYEGFSREFEPNDVGYLERQNLHRFYGELGWHDTDPGDVLLDSRQQLELYHRQNLDGLDLGTGYQINTSGTLRGFWGYFVELHLRTAHFDDREIGDGTALERAGLLGLELELESDPRRIVVGAVSSTTQVLEGGYLFEGEADLTFRVTPQLDVALSPQLFDSAGEPRFAGIGAAPGSYVFGRQRARSLGLTARATYTFTPRLSIQTYAQGFLAEAHYSHFTSPSSPERIVRLDDLVASAPPAEGPDFQEGVINANLVLRWEFHLGATAFLVYTRAQTPEILLAPGERPRLDPTRALKAPAVDVLLLKLSYWWG